MMQIGGFRMKRLFSILLALIIVLGQALPASAANAKTVTMRLQLEGDSVTVKDAGGKVLPFSQNMLIYSGCSIETGGDSFACISLDDSKVIKLDMNTSVTIRKSGKKNQIILTAGQLVFHVTEALAGNEILEIRTGNMATSVRGSSGVVSLRRIIYGTGHGRIYQADPLGALPKSFDIQGGQILEILGDGSEARVSEAQVSDFPSVYLKEVEANEQLQESLSGEDSYSTDEMIAEIPVAEQKEQAEREEKEGAVVLPPAAEEENQGEVSAAFAKVPDDPPVTHGHSGGTVVPDIPAEPSTHTVTWKNGDTVLKTDSVKEGVIPSYSGDEPQKESTEQYSYTFSGWTPEPAPATEDTVYTAQFTETPRTYAVTLSVPAEYTGVKLNVYHEDETPYEVTDNTVSVDYGEVIYLSLSTGSGYVIGPETALKAGNEVIASGSDDAFGFVRYEVKGDVTFAVSDLYRIVTSLDDLSGLSAVSEYTLDGACTLNADLYICSTLSLKAGSMLTIGEGVTVTNGGTIANSGTIINLGTLDNGVAGDSSLDGRIVNSETGLLLNCGTLASLTGGSTVENAGVFLPKDSNDDATGFTYVGDYGDALTGSGTVVTYGGLCNDDGSNVTWYLTDSETVGKYVMHITGTGAIRDYTFIDNGSGYESANYDVDSPWWDMKDNITRLDLGDRITGIGKAAFAHTEITSVTIPDSVKYLGSHSFYKSDLSFIDFGNGVTEIGDHAFCDCDNLNTIVIPDNVTIIGGSAFYSSMLYNVTIGSGVKEIGVSAFHYCTEMSVLNLSEGLESISNYAFSQCWNLTSVSIPSTVTTINTDAFSYCKKLASAYFYADPPAAFGDDVFTGTSSNFYIYYPANNVNWVIDGEGKWNGYPAESFTY